MQSREQIYAADVYKKVQAIATEYSNENAQERKEYGGMALKLPVLVRQAGLVQALAFVDSRRDKEPHKRLLADLADTLNYANAEQFLNTVRTAPLEDYMSLTEKTLLALKWYKRFAQSILKVKPTDEPDQE